jgi:hypothetical protein
VHLVLEVEHLDHKVQPVLLVQLARLVQQDPQVQQVVRELLVQQDLKVMLVRQELLEQQVQLAQRVFQK